MLKNEDLSTLQRHVLHREVSTVYTTGVWAASGLVYTKENYAASGGAHITGAGAAPELVYTREAHAASRRVYAHGPELHLDLVGQ